MGLGSGFTIPRRQHWSVLWKGEIAAAPDRVSHPWVLTASIRALPCAVQVFKSDRKVAVHISDDVASGERGLVAVRNIWSGEKMARIPLSAALTLNPAEDPEPYPDAGWALALAAKLLREAAKVCFCAPPPPPGRPLLTPTISSSARASPPGGTLT